MGARRACQSVTSHGLESSAQLRHRFLAICQNVLNDGNLEFPNNVAEQGQRIFVVGGKNLFFSDTPRGASASAAIYSITTTARANGLNPRLYIEWLLTEMPNASELTDEVVDSFMPWSPSVPQTCQFPDNVREKSMEASAGPSSTSTLTFSTTR